MTTPEISNDYFEILPKEPSLSYLKTLHNPPYMKYKLNNRVGWVIFKSKESMSLFNYLLSNKDYKAKEKLFNIDPEIFETIVGDITSTDFIQVKLEKDWIISDKKSQRQLSVFVTNKNNQNLQLLHTLYSKIRLKH